LFFVLTIILFLRNSTLQCIFNAPYFTDYFLNDEYKKDLCKKNNGIAIEFVELLSKIRTANKSDAESTISLKKVVGKICPQF
jgi:hypothetical protein